MNKKSLFEATTSHTPCAVTHQKQIHSGENIIHNPVYEANEEEWNQEFFEHLGIPNLSEERIKQGDAYVREVVERFKLAQLPYFLSLLVQLRGDVPPSSSDPNPEAPLTNVQVTDKDFLVITQCPLITEGWKNKYNDHYFPSSKDEPVAYKWVTLLIIGPFLHLSTAKIFLRAWLNNAQGLPTKVGKCLPLVNAMNTYFSQKEVVVRAPPEEGTSQPRVTIEVHVTPIPLEENFKQKDLPLPHFRWKEIGILTKSLLIW